MCWKGLAAGGMGEIFLARLEGAAGFEKLFAVKRILPHLADDERFRKMLIVEAQIASKMSHANICQVYELGETDGQLYIVMEYLEGVTLLPILRKRSKRQDPLDFGFIATVMRQTCDALHYAHELRDRTGESLRVVHRDVTPSNVFVCETGMAKVLDFGIAKMKDGTKTQTDTVKGKHAYMAPEQLRGGTLTRQVDVFALGIVLYEMIALRRLFHRTTDYLTFRAVMEQPITDIRRYRPETPDAVVDVLARALARDPAERFESVRQLDAALRDAFPQRSWSHEDVGDLVRTLFSSELEKRAAAVASAIEHTTVTPGWVSSLEDGVEEAPEGEEDSEFPAVETDGGKPFTAMGPTARPLIPRAPTPVPRAETAPPRAPSPSAPGSRAWLGWLLGVAVLGLGAAVLVLVFRDGRDPPVAPKDATDISVVSGPGDYESNLNAVRPHLGKLSQCATKYPTKLKQGIANMRLGTTGQIKTTRFEPPELDGTPLATCLRTVLDGVAFPKRAADMLFNLEINFPPPRSPPR